jgi:hypothetical protein
MAVIGSIVSGLIGLRAARDARNSANQGFNFLRSNEGVQQAQQQGQVAGANIQGLLGIGGDPAAAEQAFEQYRGSTGYQFRLGQGLSAITQSGAARGLLNSGATAKAAIGFGQNLASGEFQNYLAQLQGTQATGLNAAYNTASQGTSAGVAAGNAQIAGGNALAGGLGGALGGISDYFERTQPAAYQRYGYL